MWHRSLVLPAATSPAPVRLDGALGETTPGRLFGDLINDHFAFRSPRSFSTREPRVALGAT